MLKKSACLTAALMALAALSSTLGNTHNPPARVISVPTFVTPHGDAARNDFMRKVHDAQVKRAIERGREFFPGLPEDQLENVESGYQDAQGRSRAVQATS
jgi:hypothetical protein